MAGRRPDPRERMEQPRKPSPLEVGATVIDFDTAPVTPAELARLYGVAGWHVLPEGNFGRALAGTFFSLAARDAGRRLVGYGRVVSDGGIYSWIHDLIVVPELRGRGLGGRILQGLITHITAVGIPYIGLFAAKERAGFYEGFGFRRRPDDAPGMYLYLAPD